MAKRIYLFDDDFRILASPCRKAATATPPNIKEAASLGMIRKSELELGVDYAGVCRNASIAKWDGSKFWYIRVKFGNYYIESINHPEDDNGFDLFVPMAKIVPRKETQRDSTFKPVETQEE